MSQNHHRAVVLPVACLASLAWFAVMVFAAPALAGAIAAGGELKPFTEAIPGSQVSFDMVPIPGGEFLFGSPDGEPGRARTRGRRSR